MELDYNLVKERIEESSDLFNIERGEALRLLRIFGAKGLYSFAMKVTEVANLILKE